MKLLLETTSVVVIATLSVLIHNTVDAFTLPTIIPSTDRSATRSVAVASTSSNEASFAVLMENLPSLDELQTAPFMKQVQYGSDMTEALTAMEEGIGDNDNDSNDPSSNSELLQTLLSAQLSHSDGIRGFMVAYLTGSYESSTDEDGGIDASEMIATERDPSILLETVSGLLAESSSDGENSENSDSDDLVRLMCMNVVMPIAMITMHQDPALSAASRLTAARGIRLLGSVLGASGSMRANLEAILEAAASTAATTDSDDLETKEQPLVDFWAKFFVKWGHEEPQKKDIEAAVKEILSKSSQ